MKMDLQNKHRENDRLSETIRLKNRQVEELSERNYELEEKLRQRELKNIAILKTDVNVLNNDKELRILQEELRKKEVEVSHLKVENE